MIPQDKQIEISINYIISLINKFPCFSIQKSSLNNYYTLLFSNQHKNIGYSLCCPAPGIERHLYDMPCKAQNKMLLFLTEEAKNNLHNVRCQLLWIYFKKQNINFETSIVNKIISKTLEPIL